MSSANNGNGNGNGHGGVTASGKYVDTRFDMVLKGGRVMDPSQNIDRIADLAIKDGKIAAIEASIDRSRTKREINVEGLLVTPGLIDLHVHCNLYRNPEALDPNAQGVYAGCTRIVDPGDSGAYVFQAFRKNVVENPAIKTKIHTWLAAPALGGFMFGLYNCDVTLHPNLIDIEAAVKIISMFPHIIKGIKTYATPEGWGTNDGTEVYRKAFEICRLADVPAYIHVGTPMPDGSLVYGGKAKLYGEEVGSEQILGKMLEKMRPGDIFAHPFTAFNGSGWNLKEKRLNAGVKEAWNRGIMFDSGRGAHFTYDAVRGLFEQGLTPHTISTDKHASDQNDNWNRVSNYGMCAHMSEFMAFGMSLQDVVLRATYNPAKALRITDEAGQLKVGRPADITVMVIREGKWTFRDNPYAFGESQSIVGKERLSPVLTMVDGSIYPCNPAFLPDMADLQIQEDVWSWLTHRPERPWEYGLSEADHAAEVGKKTGH